MGENILEVAEQHAREEVFSILRKRGIGVDTFKHEIDQDGFHVHQTVVDAQSPVAIEWWFGEEENRPIYGLDLLIRDPFIVSRDFAGLFRIERMFEQPFHDKTGWHYKIEGIVLPQCALPERLRSFGYERDILPSGMDGYSGFTHGGWAQSLISSTARFFMRHVAR